MAGGKAPAPPDPYATAAAQSAMNRDTAVTQQGLNMVNQVTPYGTLTYDNIGKWDDGINGGTPRYQATTTLSPDQQRLLEIGNQTETNIANIGKDQSARIGTLLGTPFNMDAARGTVLSDVNRKFMDPQWERNKSSLDSDLINRGIRPGTEAYTRAMSDFSDQRQSAYDRMFLDSYGQGNQAALTERNQPINEITALLSNSQVQQPNLTNTPQANVQATDLSGNVYNSYQGQFAGWKANADAKNQMIGSILNTAGKVAGGAMMFSDARLKKDIRPIGMTNSGLPVYTYKYKGDDTTQMGVMAQDVEKVNPAAVAETPSGFKAVDYGRI